MQVRPLLAPLLFVPLIAACPGDPDPRGPGFPMEADAGDLDEDGDPAGDGEDVYPPDGMDPEPNCPDGSVIEVSGGELEFPTWSCRPLPLSDAGVDAAMDAATDAGDAAADAGDAAVDAGGDALDASDDAGADPLDAGHDAGATDAGQDGGSQTVEDAAAPLDAATDAALDAGPAADADVLPVEDGGQPIECSPDELAAPVDVVLALDTSGSMISQFCNLPVNLTEFALQAGPNARLVTVYMMNVNLSMFAQVMCGSAEPMDETALTADPARYLHVPSEIDSTSALSVLLQQFSQYEPFLRPNAATHFVVVSEDESALAADSFRTQMEAQLGHSFVFHAVVADGSESCVGAAPGTEYLALAEATNGQALSICSTDWGTALAQLGPRPADACGW